MRRIEYIFAIFTLFLIVLILLLTLFTQSIVCGGLQNGACPAQALQPAGSPTLTLVGSDNTVRVTILPYSSPTPEVVTATLNVIYVTATPQSTFDPAMPTYDSGRFDLPDVSSPFGEYPPAVVGSYRFYDGKTLDLVPSELEDCVDTSPVDKQECYSALQTQLLQTPQPQLVLENTGIPVYAPVAGCAFLLPDTITIVLIVNCEQNISFETSDGAPIKGRREVMLTHLDPQTTKHISTSGTKVDPSEYLGSLCLMSDKASCNIITDLPPYLSMKLRINTGLDYFAATNEEILAFLAQPKCLYDQFLYSPLNPSLNPQPLQACPKE
jgi:hypothetical protein